MPSGELFIHFKRTTLLFDPANQTNPTRRVAASRRSNKQTGETRHLYSRTGGGPGTCCLLPLLPKRNEQTGEIEYGAGRILILGGGGAEKEPEPADPTELRRGPTVPRATNCTRMFRPPTPRRFLISERPIQNGRRRLPCTTGASCPTVSFCRTPRCLWSEAGIGQSGGLLAHFTSVDTQGNPDKGASDPVFEPEMFDPETKTWRLLARKPLARLYHTTAVLLADGRVLVAGHDGALDMPPYDTSRYELELYSPPYLFGPDGQLAPRPIIISAPDQVPLGQRFVIGTPNGGDISSVASPAARLYHSPDPIPTAGWLDSRFNKGAGYGAAPPRWWPPWITCCLS